MRLRGDFGIFALVFQRYRLGLGNALLLSELFDWRRLQLHAPSCRAIGLREHERQIETGLMQRGKGDGSKLGRAGEDDFH